MTDASSFARIMVEACVDSVHTALVAEAAGAGRVELCGPGIGGTTPSFGLMARCRERVRVPMHVMIRPREGDFDYDEDEFETMLKDVNAARSARADGVVFGVLRSDNTLDEERMRRLVDAAQPMKTACHRAFDATPDAVASLETLLRLDVDLVLTSGHAVTALLGREQLAAHCARAVGTTLKVMGGGGIRADNVLEVVSDSGVRDVHLRATDPEVFAAVMRKLGRHPVPFSD